MAAADYQKVTILHLEGARQFGGSVRCLQNFLAHTSSPSMRHVVGLYAPLDATAALAAASAGVHVAPGLARADASPERPVLNVLCNVRRFAWISRLIRTYRVSLVRLNNGPALHGAAVLAARAARVPCVAWLRSFPAQGASVERRWQGWIAKYVAVSDAVKAAYVDAGVSADRICTSYDGTSVPAEPCEPTPGPTFRVGMAGRLVRWKGLLDLVAAAELVVRECPTARFEIMGNGDASEPAFRSDLLAEIQRRQLQPYVVVRDFSPDPTAFLRSLDCVANPSFPAEPFGMSVIEAMALSRPVVATVGGGPSEIIEDGVSGLLVPPHDPGALAAALVRLGRDPARRRAIAAATHPRVLARFEVRRQVAQQERLLLDLVVRRSSREPVGVAAAQG